MQTNSNTPAFQIRFVQKKEKGLNPTSELLRNHFHSHLSLAVH